MIILTLEGTCYYEILVSENICQVNCSKEKPTYHHFFSTGILLAAAILAGSQSTQPTTSAAATSTNNQEASGPVTSNSDPNTSNWLAENPCKMIWCQTSADYWWSDRVHDTHSWLKKHPKICSFIISDSFSNSCNAFLRWIHCIANCI